jgi:hypothetical protein
MGISTDSRRHPYAWPVFQYMLDDMSETNARAYWTRYEDLEDQIDKAVEKILNTPEIIVAGSVVRTGGHIIAYEFNNGHQETPIRVPWDGRELKDMAIFLFEDGPPGAYLEPYGLLRGLVAPFVRHPRDSYEEVRFWRADFDSYVEKLISGSPPEDPRVYQNYSPDGGFPVEPETLLDKDLVMVPAKLLCQKTFEYLDNLDRLDKERLMTAKQRSSRQKRRRKSFRKFASSIATGTEALFKATCDPTPSARRTPLKSDSVLMAAEFLRKSFPAEISRAFCDELACLVGIAFGIIKGDLDDDRIRMRRHVEKLRYDRKHTKTS